MLKTSLEKEKNTIGIQQTLTP